MCNLSTIVAAILISFLLVCSTHAQWVQTNGPCGVHITCFAVFGENLYAGTSYGVFLSTNEGASWTPVNSGLTNAGVNALCVSGTNIFVVAQGGIS